ncbi:hypothetical protein DFP73DRAFT_561095 [Morchella snyderi]|nr:hypothetical protein DFP73DRAFT_561095 [Morchella snyderi]
MPSKSETPCKYHQRSTCHRGRTCSYLHSPAPTTASVSPPSASTLRPTAQPFTPPCRFAARGYCSRPHCPYTHPPPLPPPPPPPPAPTTLSITLANHTVTFGPGLTIQSATPTLMPTLHIHHLPPTVTPALLAALLAPYEPKDITHTPTHAAVRIPAHHLPTAIKALHATRVHGTIITATAAPTPGTASTRADTLLVSYPAPSRNATLVLPLDCPALRQEGTVCGRHVRTAAIGSGMFHVTGLPPSARASDVLRGLRLPATCEVHLGAVSYEEDEPGASGAYVRSVLEGDGGRVVVSSEIVNVSGAVRMVVRMGSGEMARGAAAEVHRMAYDFIGGGIVSARVQYDARLRTAPGVWEVVGAEVKALQREMRVRFVRVGVFKDGGAGRGEDEGRGGHVSVTVSGCDRTAVCEAKRQIMGIIAGEVVASPGGIPVWSDSLMAAPGIRMLKAIQAETGTYIHYDVHKRQIAAYGAPAARIAARERLITHLASAHSPALPTPPPEPPAGEDECPVCLTEPTGPVVVPTCGHTYCGDCLSAFLASAPSTRIFPIACIACQSPLPLSLIPTATLPAAAWSDHVLRNAGTLHFCATTDCPGVLPVSTGDGGADSEGESCMAMCGECLVEQCTRCHLPSHDGMSCADWRVASDTEAERLFSEWAAGHDVKQCGGPGCGALIEKVDGCNHVHCPRCRAHMCWVCSGLFTRGEVYVHMREAHGGIGLEDGLDADFQPVEAHWDAAALGW